MSLPFKVQLYACVIGTLTYAQELNETDVSPEFLKEVFPKLVAMSKKYGHLKKPNMTGAEQEEELRKLLAYVEALPE